MSNSKIIWDYFKSKDLNEYGIAGILGNLDAESALIPTNLQNTYNNTLHMTDKEYTDAVDNGTYTNFVNDSAGYGLAQWTYWSLKRDLLNFAKQSNKSIGDLNMQLDFLWHEFNADFKSVLKTLKNATSILEASNAMLLNFERPADQSERVQKQRASFGEKYYNKYHKKQMEGDTKMKYSENNKPLVCMQTTSTCYTNTRKMEVKGVLWHSTGANNPYIERYVQPSDNDPNREQLIKILGKNPYGNDWNHVSVQAGLNCWIGKLDDESVATVQSMPWDYRPWGCGSGPKGSCNNGWIQFEICEDNLNNRDYFEKVYKEGCEITAYLCKMFNLDPHGTVDYAGQKVPVITCHCESHDYGLGSNHGDVLHWFSRYGKDMNDIRNDVAELMHSIPVKPDPEPIKPTPSGELYRVRKSWEDAKSQIGAYSIWKNAVKACNEAGQDYNIYNAIGEKVYPEEIKPITPTLKVGDEVRLVAGATYANGGNIPNWVFESKLYLRQIYENGDYVISTLRTGAVTGVVHPSSIVSYDTNTEPVFNPYLVKITASVLNVRSGPSTDYQVNTQVHRNEVFTIIAEDGEWGKLKSGAGWIYLDYTEKM